MSFMNNIKLLKAQAKLALTQVNKKIAEPIKKYIIALEMENNKIKITIRDIKPAKFYYIEEDDDL